MWYSSIEWLVILLSFSITENDDVIKKMLVGYIEWNIKLCFLQMKSMRCNLTLLSNETIRFNMKILLYRM